MENEKLSLTDTAFQFIDAPAAETDLNKETATVKIALYQRGEFLDTIEFKHNAHDADDCDFLARKNDDAYQFILEGVFHQAAEKAAALPGGTEKRFKNPLRIIDSPAISLRLAKFDWAEYRKAEGAVELHLCLDGDSLFPCDAYPANGKAAGVKAMEKLCVEKAAVYVLDRGYVDYKSLYSIDLAGSFFVTRLKRGRKFKRAKNNERDKNGPVRSDVHIQLSGSKTKSCIPNRFGK